MKKIGTIVIAFAALQFALEAKADYVWNGGGETTDWSDAANWTGSSGNWVNKVSGSTVTFTNAVTISSGVWIENGVTNGESMVTWKKGTDAEDGAGLTGGTTLTVGTATKGGLKIEDGDYTFSGTMYLGNGANGQGAVTMNGGHLKVGGELNMSRQNNSQSEFVMNGGLLEVTSWFAVSRANANTDSGCVSTFTVNGGVVTNSNSGSSHMSIGTVGSASNYGELIVNGGEVYASAIPYIAEISPGKLTVNGGKFTTPSSMQIGMAAGVTGAVEVAKGELKSSGTVQVGYKSGGYGNFLLSGGSVNAYTLNVGAVSGANGEMTMSGGTVNCSAQFNVGILGSTATYNQTGGMVNAATGWWGADNNTHAVANISGGEMNFSGQLALGNGNNAYMELNVNGGTLNLNADPLFGQLNGSGSTNIVTISNGGVINVGSETAAKWMKINDAGTAANEFYLRTGGTLGVAHIEKVSSDTGSKIVFDGGTLKSLYVDSNYNKYIIENDDTLSVEVTELGGIIDVNGHAVQLPKAIGGTGMMTLTNSTATEGSITISGEQSYLGIRVADGVTANLGTSFAATNKVILAGGMITSTTVIDEVELVSGSYTNNIAGAGSYKVNGGALAVNLSSFTAHESVGFSTNLVDIVLANEDELARVTDCSVGHYTWTFTMNAADNTLIATIATSTYDNFWIGGASGEFYDAANWSLGHYPTTGEYDIVTNDVNFTVNSVHDIGILVNESYNISFVRSSGSNNDKIHVTGVLGSGTITLDYFGFGNVNGNECLVYNDIVLTNSAWFGDYNYSINMKFYGGISGSGSQTVQLWGSSGDYYFYGDNSGFASSMYTCNGNPAIHFMTSESGFSNSGASLTAGGSVYFDCDAETVVFGSLTVSGGTGKMIYVPSSEQTARGVLSSYYKLVQTTSESGSTSISFELDPEVVEPVASETSITMSESAFSVTPSNIKKGLKYGLVAIDSPTAAGTPSEYVTATSDSLTLSISTLPGANESVKYYRIYVQD